MMVFMKAHVPFFPIKKLLFAARQCFTWRFWMINHFRKKLLMIMLSHVYWKKCGSKRSYIKSKPICISIYEYVIKAMSLNLSSNNAEQRLPGLQIQLHSCTIKTGVHGEAKHTTWHSGLGSLSANKLEINHNAVKITVNHKPSQFHHKWVV